MTKRAAPLFLIPITLLPLMGCSSDEPASTDCAGGNVVDVGADRYCAYLVVEGGFECPAAAPYKYSFESGIACAPTALDPGDLPETLCMMFSQPCSEADGPFDADGGTNEDAASSDAGTDAARDVSNGQDAGTCTGDPVPDTIAPTASAKFEFTVPAGSYVVTFGQHCKAFDVSPDVVEELSPYDTFACEGPRAQMGVSRAESNPVMTWGGATLLSYRECIDCAERGFPELGVQSYLKSAITAAPAGDYEITFPVLDSVPAGCLDTEGVLNCGEYIDYDGTLDLCEADRTVTVSFTLPASGEVTVPVVVPAP